MEDFDAPKDTLEAYWMRAVSFSDTMQPALMDIDELLAKFSKGKCKGFRGQRRAERKRQRRAAGGGEDEGLPLLWPTWHDLAMWLMSAA